VRKPEALATRKLTQQARSAEDIKMPMIFTRAGGSLAEDSNRGRVSLLEGAPGAFQMADWRTGGGNLTTFKSLITDVGIQERGNYQFLHTLGNDIYLYIFGDRIGEFSVSGVSFWSVSTGRGCDNNPMDLGITRVITWYRENRVVAREQPIIATLGTRSFQLYLVGLRASVSNLNQRMFQFSMDLAMLPEEKSTSSISTDRET
jgi:hypothetical protein